MIPIDLIFVVKNIIITIILMDLTLSQLEDLTKEEKSTIPKGKFNVERKIQLALKKKQHEETLQTYTNNKIKSIHKMLDTVEEVRAQPSQVIDYLEREHEYQARISQLSGTLQTQQIELDEQRRTVENLKTMLEKQNSLRKELDVSLNEQMNTRLNEQKQQFEQVIQRHQTFMNQLVEDKRELNTQIETLTNELKHIDEVNKKQLADQKAQFQRELKQTKDAWVASEKQRKERWQAEKIAEIKEQTVRGLEPEIERMVEKHRKDVKRVEERCQREMELFQIKTQEEYETKFRAQREKLIAENEQIIKKEREAVSLRTKDSYEKFNKELEIEREKIKKRYDSDLQDVEKRRNEEADGYVKRIRVLQEEQAEEIRRIKSECQSQIDEMRYQQTYLEKMIKDQLKNEQQAWMEQQVAKMQSDLNKKLLNEQQRMEKERNEQIDLILQKLAGEQANMEKEVTGRYEKRIRDLNLQHEEDTKNLKRQLKTYEEQDAKKGGAIQTSQEQLEIMSKKYLELQTELNNLKQELKQTKQQLQISSENLRNQQEENNTKLKSLKEQQEIEIKQLQKQINELNGEIQEQKMAYESIFQEQEYKHTEELESVESRVKKILQKNQQEMNKLKDELKMKEMACQKYEEMLRRQREDLLRQIEK